MHPSHRPWTPRAVLRRAACAVLLAAAGAPAGAAAQEVGARLPAARSTFVGDLADLAGVDAPAVREARRSVSSANSASSQAQTEPDFLFERPGTSISLRGLWSVARAQSDFYDFVHEQLFVRQNEGEDANDMALGRMSFDAPGFGLEVTGVIAPRLDVGVGIELTRAFARSELRQFIGSDGLPIEQETALRQFDLYGTLKFALLPRGRAIGQYAWIPSRIVPYLGVGGGLLHHSLQQTGEFVDPTTLELFPETFGSSGWTLAFHVVGGWDIQLTPRVQFTMEARAIRASDEMRCRRRRSTVFGPPEPLGFCGFEPLDLWSLRYQGGLRFLF